MKLKNRILLCGLCASAFVFNAAAQLTNINYPNYQTGQPNFFTADTNSAAYNLTNAQTQTFTPGSTSTLAKTIRQNQGVGLFLAVWGTNGASSASTNYTISFDVTGDGATWTQGSGARPITWTVYCVIPGTNVFWTNIPATSVSNVRKMQATKTSTTCATNIQAAFGYSQSTQ